MARLFDIDSYLASYLRCHDFPSDGALNGLNVEGKSTVRTIAFAVSPTKAVLEKAVARNADAIITHHSLFFKDNARKGISGALKGRLTTLLSSRVSLLCYHLPLDYHEESGNNVLLLNALGASYRKRVGKVHDIQGALFVGEFPKPVSRVQLAKKLHRVARKPHVVATGPSRIRTIAVCTGGAHGQDFLVEAGKNNVTSYVTGEISEHVPSLAQELNMNFFAAGHYATETFGVRSLAKVLEKQFSVRTFFIKEDNPY
jgi:dinuclear metal center YbgI/SA1388 family protein